MAEPINLAVRLKIESVDASELEKKLGKAVGGTTAAGSGGAQGTFAAAKMEQLVGYQQIAKPINEAMAKMVNSLTGAMKESGMGAAAGGIGAILQLVLGEALDEIINILQSIVRLILTITGIGPVLKAISDMFNAFWDAFKPLGTVWTQILTMITRMVQPFVNLLIPLLLPFLYLASIMARIINTTLMPIFQLLMKAVTPSGAVMQTAIQQILSGDLMGGIMTVLTAVAENLKGVMTEITAKLRPLFDMLAGWIMSFLTLDLTKVHDVINNLLGDKLGGIVNGMIDIGYKFISALMGIIAQLVGSDTFDKIFGTGAFANVEKTNSAFEKGVDFAKVLQQLWDAITGFAKLLGSDADLAIRALIGLIVIQLTGAIMQFILAIKDVIDQLIKLDDPAINQLMEAGILLTQGILNVALTAIPHLISSIEYVADSLKLFVEKFQAEMDLIAATSKNNLTQLNPLASKEEKDKAFEELNKTQARANYVGSQTVTFKEKTASDIYGDKLADTMKNLNDGLQATYDSLVANDVKGALEGNAKIFGTLTQGLQTVSDSIVTAIIDPDKIGVFSTNLGSLNGVVTDWSTAMANFHPADYMQSAIDKLVYTIEQEANARAKAKETSGGTSQDFIMRPGSGAVNFSPNDTIIGVKNPSDLRGGGGGSITNNYYITGYTDSQLVDKLKTTIESVDARQSRGGKYQKGY